MSLSCGARATRCASFSGGRFSPATALDDRGLLPLNLDVSGLGDGELVFRTGTGPSGNKASDWTCWQGLTLK
jgi:hypothetical protein